MIAQFSPVRSVSEYMAAQHSLIEDMPLAPLLEPRRIHPPGRYHSPKSISIGLFLLLGQGRLKHHLGLEAVPSEITAHVIAYQLIRYGMSAFFVSEEFARAVAATDVPSDFTINDLHWPLPAMVVAFPFRFMQEYLGRDVCYVYAANCDAGDYHVPALPGCPTISVPKNKVAWRVSSALTSAPTGSTRQSPVTVIPTTRE